MVVWKKGASYLPFVNLARLTPVVRILPKEPSWSLDIKTIFTLSPKVATMFLRDAPIQVTKFFSILMTIISWPTKTFTFA